VSRAFKNRGEDEKLYNVKCSGRQVSNIEMKVELFQVLPFPLLSYINNEGKSRKAPKSHSSLDYLFLGSIGGRYLLAGWR
jgi:hypothetical protein